MWLFGYFLGEGWWGRINPIYQKSHASGNYNRTYGIFTTCIAQVSLKEENRKIEKRPCPIICNTQALSLESDCLRDQKFNSTNLPQCWFLGECLGELSGEPGGVSTDKHAFSIHEDIIVMSKVCNDPFIRFFKPKSSIEIYKLEYAE